MRLLEMNPDFLDRSVNEGFLGGEKKRNEMLMTIFPSSLLFLMQRKQEKNEMKTKLLSR